jgi:hypothetical protein
MAALSDAGEVEKQTTGPTTARTFNKRARNPLLQTMGGNLRGNTSNRRQCGKSDFRNAKMPRPQDHVHEGCAILLE